MWSLGNGTYGSKVSGILLARLSHMDQLRHTGYSIEQRYYRHVRYYVGTLLASFQDTVGCVLYSAIASQKCCLKGHGKPYWW